MHIKSYLVGLLLLVSFLSGCIASAPIIDSDSVKNDGLLVGQITSTSIGRIMFYGDVKISGETFRKAITGAYIRLPLKPGTYEFEQISNVYSSTSGNLKTTTTTRYPVSAKFTIKAGEVTNLGKVVLYFPDPTGKKYKTILVDNVEDMQAFLRTEHPSAYNALRTKKFRKADTTYAGKKQIETLRTVMLARNVRSASQSQYRYLTGDLGSLAKVTWNKQRKITKINFIETGTYENIGPCANENGRFGCMVAHPIEGRRLYVAGDKDLHARKLPTSEKNFQIKLIGKNDIVLVTNRMDIYTSMDNGKSWNAYTSSRLKDPLEYTARPQFSFGRQGYYIYSKGQDATILYRKHGARSYEVIEPPKRGDYLNGLTETDKGLYAGPEFTMISNAQMFFRASGQNKWVKYEIPTSSCGRFEIIDRAKDRIAAKCSNKYLVTDDHGKTWRQSLRSELRK